MRFEREVDENEQKQHLRAPSIVSHLLYPLRNSKVGFCSLNPHEGEILTAPVNALQKKPVGKSEVALLWKAMDWV